MALLEAIGLLSIIVALLYFFLTKNHNYWEKRGIPYEKPLPLLGNFWDTIIGKTNQGGVVTTLYHKHKGKEVVGMFNFLTPALLVRDVDLANRLLTTDFQNFAYNNFESSEDIDPVASRNMFTQRDEKWKRTRQLVTPAFTLGRIKNAYPLIQDSVKKLVKWLEDNPEAEVKRSLSQYSCEVFAGIGVGIDGHSFSEKSPILLKLGAMIFNSSFMKFIKFLIVLYSPFLTKLFKVRIVPQDVPDFFDGMLTDIVKKREASAENRNDLLQYYIDVRKKRLTHKHDDQNDITIADIIGGLATFFVESYETIPTVSSLLIFHLIKDQKLQAELREEIDSVYEKYNGEIPMEVLLELPLLERITAENSRLYGAQNMGKECSKDCYLELKDGKSIFIEKGTAIQISVQGIHNDPEFWEHPDQFYPDHFSEEAKKSRRKNVYFPFGDGPRMCIGMRLAKVIMKTSVVNLIRKFELIPTSKTASKYIQDPRHFFTSPIGGVHCKFVRRKNIK